MAYQNATPMYLIAADFEDIQKMHKNAMIINIIELTYMTW